MKMIKNKSKIKALKTSKDTRNSVIDVIVQYGLSVENFGNTIDVIVKDENIWLTQKAIAELYGTTRENITMHIKSIFSDHEQDENSVSKFFLHTAKDNKKYNTMFYSLEMILSIGYRVNSNKAIEFRQWATKILKDFTIRGYVIDKERLENTNNVFDADYFEHALEEIREIRMSERKWYQKITDLYATSYDYDPLSPNTIDFFKSVQNKMHYAAHGNTAAEVIYNRADHKKQNMGLTSWKNSPTSKIVKSDVIIAKNYLSKDELNSLERIVSLFLDYGEMQALQHNHVSMQDWKDKLEKFIKFNDKEVLNDLGKISHSDAIKKAETEFDKYRVIQDKKYISEFDKLLKEIGKGEKK